MQAVAIVAIVFGGAILVLAIIGGVPLLALKILKGGVSPGEQRRAAEETRLIQELYQGLGRMEERVEALETILLEREKGRRYDDETL